MIIMHNNIFTSGAQTLVCTVNRVGVMGAGLALYFSIRYPTLKAAYKKACKTDIFDMQGFFLFEDPSGIKILCFPSKRHWSTDTALEDIIQGLEDIVAHYEALGITSIAMPLVGCGKGGLDPYVVTYEIERYLAPLPIPIYLSQRN